MGKFLSVENDLNSLFGSPAWEGEGTPVFPVNLSPEGLSGDYCRFSIVPGDSGIPAYSKHENVSGVIMIEIYTAAGKGPKANSLIADKLDKHLQQKTIGGTQFYRSTMSALTKDADNPALARAIYQIPFHHFGVG